jgi:hypothetical protein
MSLLGEEESMTMILNRGAAIPEVRHGPDHASLSPQVLFPHARTRRSTRIARTFRFPAFRARPTARRPQLDHPCGIHLRGFLQPSARSGLVLDDHLYLTSICDRALKRSELPVETQLPSNLGRPIRRSRSSQSSVQFESSASRGMSSS